MKMLSKEKNLTIPWYLLCLTEKKHEKIRIMTVPETRINKFIETY
jgi:hypothetical protein